MPSTQFLPLKEERGLRVAFTDTPALGSYQLTIVLLPGMGDMKEEFRLLIPQLSAYRVIAMDLRGMGESDVKFSSYEPKDTGSDVVALLDHLDLKNAVLVGCSMCAASVTYAAAERPGRVRAFGFLSPFAWDHPMPFGISTLLNLLINTWTGPTVWTSAYKDLYTLKPSPVSDLDAYVKKLGVNLREPGRIAAFRGHIFGSKAPCADKFPLTIAIPAFTVYGAKDPDFPGVNGIANEVVELKKHCPQIGDNVLIVDGAGHYPHVECPQVVAQFLISFLNSL